MNLQALKQELILDPLGRGYSSLSDEAAAATFSILDRSVNRDALDGGLLVSCIVRAEFSALTAGDKDYLHLIAATATPIPLTAGFKAEVGAVFGAGTATRANLLAAVKRAGNRAEELNLGRVPTTSDIADAKRS